MTAERIAREYLEWVDKPVEQRSFDGDYWEHLGDAYRDVTPLARAFVRLLVRAKEADELRVENARLRSVIADEGWAP